MYLTLLLLLNTFLTLGVYDQKSLPNPLELDFQLLRVISGFDASIKIVETGILAAITLGF